MKNIHIIPTDKPSRLFKVSGELKLTRNFDFYNGSEYQNIYITSDEEIKDVRPHKGKWQLEKEQILNKFPNYLTDLSECKLVIMTTDPDLIADGVQSISDEFLEWFVKNPSCEEVEVKKWFDGVDFLEYEIIIPQEDPFEKSKLALRAYLLANKEKVMNDLQEMREKSSVDRNETPEEAAETWVFETNGHKWSNNDNSAGDNYGSFMAGAEWQSERMYSEEEVEKMVRAAYTFGEKEFKYFGAFKEWFEQFKKK
jgi:hypothetical protein